MFTRRAKALSVCLVSLFLAVFGLQAKSNSPLAGAILDASGKAIPGAQLISRLTVASDAPIYSQAVTNAEGIAEMKIFLEESALADAAVLVQATHEGRHATRKFRLHRTA